jgi:hypothetical protein
VYMTHTHTHTHPSDTHLDGNLVSQVRNCLVLTDSIQLYNSRQKSTTLSKEDTYLEIVSSSANHGISSSCLIWTWVIGRSPLKLHPAGQHCLWIAVGYQSNHWQLEQYELIGKKR